VAVHRRLRLQHLPVAAFTQAVKPDIGSESRFLPTPPAFEPVFESLHSWIISYGGWDSFRILGGTVAEGTSTKVSCYSWNIEQLLTGRAQDSRGLIRKQK